MRRLSLFAVLTLFFLGATSLHAQTYTQTKPAPCHAALSGHYPPTSFYQFDCSGITYPGNIDWQVTPNFSLFTPTWYLAARAGITYVVTEFIRPANGNDGTFAFKWSGNATDGFYHSGTVYGTWTEKEWDGWFYQTIQNSTLTMNQ